MAELAAGAGKTALEMPVDVESAAEHLAGIDDGEVADVPALAEPPVADEKRPRMVVEQDRQREALLERVAQCDAVQRRHQVHPDDRADIGIDHAADRNAD